MYGVNEYLIPFEGWTVIIINLHGNDNPKLFINVPFLVSHMPLERPILGFSVVKELIEGRPEHLAPTLISLLSSAIAVSSEQAQSFVSFELTPKESRHFRQLRIKWDGIVIPAGKITLVKCRVPANSNQSDSVALFEPEENNV